MRSTFKVLFYLKKNAPKANGKVPLMGRITVNGSIAQFSCKFDVAPQLWDLKSNRAAGKSLEAQKINREIDNIRVRITKHYQRISDNDAYVSAIKVRDAYLGMGEEYKTLLSLFAEQNDNFKKHVGVDRVQSTFRKYRSVHAKLAGFIKQRYRNYDIPLKELEPEFIENFALYLMTERVPTVAAGGGGIFTREVTLWSAPDGRSLLRLARMLRRIRWDNLLMSMDFLRVVILPSI